MGDPILWAPGIFTFFLQENLHVHKTPRFLGGGILGCFGQGGSADIILMGAGIFLNGGKFIAMAIIVCTQTLRNLCDAALGPKHYIMQILLVEEQN